MVEIRNSGLESEWSRDELPLMLEIVEDDLEETYGPLNKRSRLLDEPSPLGLKLSKSPSLLDLIQMRLQASSVEKKESKSSEKMKACNFPASVLKIGEWEYKSRYEGDLVAKCYLAKQRLVWEVLEQGLKSKIEIQWSDIMDFKANFPEDGPGTLTLVLSRPPLFFREMNPQPRKHTLWQVTSDFTHGQASINRKHFLQCGQGIMNKHFEKLVQCDHRLFRLSQQPEIVMDSPYFDRMSPYNSGSEAVVNTMDCGHNGLYQSMSLSDFLALLSDSSQVDDVPGLHQSMSLSDFVALLSDSQVPGGLDQSMSVSDFVGYLSDYSAGGNHLDHKEKLEMMKQQLLSDNIEFQTPDEKSLMPRVHSLFNLLYKDSNVSANSEVNTETSVGFESELNDPKEIVSNNNNHRVLDPQGMFRKDSFSDLLLHLPRITSLPKFL